MFAKVDTPAVLIDIDTVKSNITNFQNHCDTNGLKLRPHIKTHKIPKFDHLYPESFNLTICNQNHRI